MPGCISGAAKSKQTKSHEKMGKLKSTIFELPQNSSIETYQTTAIQELIDSRNLKICLSFLKSRPATVVA
jgi:hypothetical protein